jgi:hypothetical protein
MPERAVDRVRVLRWLITFSVVSTGIHFTHNFVKVDSYPSDLAPPWLVQAVILLSWPVLTAIGVRGYRLYRDGRLHDAHIHLAAYSVLGISTLGHFLEGTPDIPAFFFATIFTDGLAGFSILAFVLLSMRAQRRRPEAPPLAADGPA